MARKLQDAQLNNRTSREKLNVRKKPYFRFIDKGCHLGYYKGTLGGTWIARYFNKSGRYEEVKIGVADDKRDADGIKVFSFSQARAKTEAWFTEQMLREEGLNSTGVYTVSDALNDYLSNYLQRGGKAIRDVKSRISSLIFPYLGEVHAQKLKTQQIRDWHNELANTPPRLRTRRGNIQAYKSPQDDLEYVRRRKATANRILTILKAALNYGFQEGKITSDKAWRRIKPFREVETAKIRYLSHTESSRLSNTCDPEFRPLVQAALLTGCRYSELTNLKRNDFDPTSGTLTVRISKSGRARHVALNSEGVSFFSTMTAGIPNESFIFTMNNGNQWGKSYQQRRLKNACQRANIEPIVTFHILRHTYATHLVQAGIPLTVIAANLGHSDTRMTAKHYAHLAPSYVADVIRTSMPKFGLVEDLNIHIFSKNSNSLGGV